MREQPTRTHTGKVQKRIAFIGLGVGVILLGLSIWFLLQYERPYTPPAFDSTAKVGVPTLPENSGYGPIEAQGLFSFSVMGVMYQQADGSLELYFTNPAESDVNLQCEVFNEQGKTLYKSGVLRPGEYVEQLPLLLPIPNEAMKIEMKVYAFEQDTWFSRGGVSLSNVLQAY